MRQERGKSRFRYLGQANQEKLERQIELQSVGDNIQDCDFPVVCKYYDPNYFDIVVKERGFKKGSHTKKVYFIDTEPK